jgi:hypothetical protein
MMQSGDVLFNGMMNVHSQSVVACGGVMNDGGGDGQR